MQLVIEKSATVSLVLWATVDWSWSKMWNWRARADLHCKKKKKKSAGGNRRTFPPNILKREKSHHHYHFQGQRLSLYGPTIVCYHHSMDQRLFYMDWRISHHGLAAVTLWIGFCDPMVWVLWPYGLVPVILQTGYHTSLTGLPYMATMISLSGLPYRLAITTSLTG